MENYFLKRSFFKLFSNLGLKIIATLIAYALFYKYGLGWYWYVIFIQLVIGFNSRSGNTFSLLGRNTDYFEKSFSVIALNVHAGSVYSLFLTTGKAKKGSLYSFLFSIGEARNHIYSFLGFSIGKAKEGSLKTVYGFSIGRAKKGINSLVGLSLGKTTEGSIISWVGLSIGEAKEDIFSIIGFSIGKAEERILSFIGFSIGKAEDEITSILGFSIGKAKNEMYSFLFSIGKADILNGIFCFSFPDFKFNFLEIETKSCKEKFLV